MANETLARRYATAVFSLASERGVVETVSRDMRGIATAIHADSATAEFFIAPVIDRYEKERVLIAAFEGKVDELALHAVLLLVRKHREALLSELIAQYEILERRSRGAEPLTVITARDLAPAELAALVERLERTYDKKFDVSVKRNPDLIGGVRVTMGDRRIDGSISGRLEELARTMFAQGN